MTLLTFAAFASLGALAVAAGVLAGEVHTALASRPDRCSVATYGWTVEATGPGAAAECDRLLRLRAPSGARLYWPAPATGEVACRASVPGLEVVVRTDGGGAEVCGGAG